MLTCFRKDPLAMDDASNNFEVHRHFRRPHFTICDPQSPHPLWICPIPVPVGVVPHRMKDDVNYPSSGSATAPLAAVPQW